MNGLEPTSPSINLQIQSKALKTQHFRQHYECIQWGIISFYFLFFYTIAALYAKICPQNLTNIKPSARNSTAIIASIFMRIHVANPRPLDRFLRFIVLCFFYEKKLTMSHFARCDVYAAVFALDVAIALRQIYR